MDRAGETVEIISRNPAARMPLKSLAAAQLSGNAGSPAAQRWTGRERPLKSLAAATYSGASAGLMLMLAAARQPKDGPGGRGR